MRKIITFFTICLFATTSLLAQDQTTKTKSKGAFGLRSGVNLSSVNLETTSGSSDAGWKSGFVAGAFVRIPISGNFSLQPEFLYSSLGAKIDESVNNDNRYRLNYFTIPVLAKIRLNKMFSVVAGPQVNFLIQAKRVEYNGDNKSFYKETDSFEESDFGVTGGVEMDLFKCLNVSARYLHGLKDIDPSSLREMKNQAVQFTLGVTF